MMLLHASVNLFYVVASCLQCMDYCSVVLLCLLMYCPAEGDGEEEGDKEMESGREKGEYIMRKRERREGYGDMYVAL